MGSSVTVSKSMHLSSTGEGSTLETSEEGVDKTILETSEEDVDKTTLETS